MATISEIEKLVLSWPEKERAQLASSILQSLPRVVSDEDEGLSEALRRDAELEADPAMAITLEQLDQKIAVRRK